MDKYHNQLLKQIIQISQVKPFVSSQGASYAGHSDKSYNLSAGQLRQIVKEFVKKNKNLTLDEYIDLLNSVYTQSASATEKYLGGYLLEYYANLRKNLDPKLLDTWLENLTGWAQVDSLCQSRFSANEMEVNWSAWQSLLKKFNIAENISKRRASLVLLVLPVRESSAKKFCDLAFANIDSIKYEKDILIAKAISWLLREMVKLHKDEVQTYLNLNKDALPKIAIRETRNKIKTGKK